MNSGIAETIASLRGPVLVIGASGFIGANLLRACLAVRPDVHGTVFSGGSWRLEGLPADRIAHLNLLDPVSVASVLDRIAPATVFDCSSYGAYPFEQDVARIHSTNQTALVRLLEDLSKRGIAAYVHAGTSSEYGLNSSAPREDSPLLPDSHYAVSKASAALAISYYGKVAGLPVVNLRLYSVYGPWEDSSRLVPALCERSLHGRLPAFAARGVTRDFIHVDDVVAAFVLAAAAAARPELAGASFNIGTGKATSLEEIAALSRRLFDIADEPSFDTAQGRHWDRDHWVAAPEMALAALGWKALIPLEDGLRQTREWWREHLLQHAFEALSKQSRSAPRRNSVSAIVACHRDEPAIPVMHERLVAVFAKAGVDYEIIFVDDGSPDNSLEVIRELSSRDPRVTGISHSRNFGSQAAFRSGMEIASKEACVLLDGDLQDPPEIITEFLVPWRDGRADVVYGRRVRREMPRVMEWCYKGFYRLFAVMSEVPMPRDAGDFSLIDRSVIHWILQCRERDSFLRGLRAYVGFRQVAVDYIRPERAFGRSTNNWIRNIGWAKKAVFSFSRVPLHTLTALGAGASVLSLLLGTAGVLIKWIAPEQAPRGITYLALLQMFFGSLILLGIGLLGEYIGKILEETKARPAFIRKGIVRNGEIREAGPA